MLTPGETISATIRYAIASPNQVGEQALREKCLFFLQEGADKLHTLAPWWWRLRDGTVSVAGGNPLSNLPTDFAQFGDAGHVYVQGQPGRPALRWVEPPMMAALLESNTVAQQYPFVYTLWSKSNKGRNMIRTHPTTLGNVTLEIERYVGRTPYLIDCPAAPLPTVGGPGNVEAGAHRWKVTFLTAAGAEFTEGGIESPIRTLTVGSQVQLTSIPTSPVWSVVSRNIYRTVAGGDTFLLLTNIADNVTTTFLDDISDASIGPDTAPTPADATGVGFDQFPEDWQRSLMYEYLKASVAQGQGDVRDRAWFEDWEKEARRMWSQLQQGKNFPKFLPRFGQRMPIGRFPTPIDRLRNA